MQAGAELADRFDNPSALIPFHPIIFCTHNWQRGTSKVTRGCGLDHILDQIKEKLKKLIGRARELQAPEKSAR